MLAAADFYAGRVTAVPHSVGTGAGDAAPHAPKSHRKVRMEQRPILASASPVRSYIGETVTKAISSGEIRSVSVGFLRNSPGGPQTEPVFGVARLRRTADGSAR